MELIPLNIPLFRSFYPQFADISDDILNMTWIRQSFYGNGIVCNYSDSTQQEYIRFLILAHLLQISLNSTVGRVASATEGSVSGIFAYNDSQSGSWWNQTPFGAEIWQLMKSIYGATYFPGNRRGIYAGNRFC